MNSKQCTILLPSREINKNVLNLFLIMLHNNWPDCPYKIIVAGDILKPISSDISPKIINSGYGSSWGSRVKKAIDYIDTPFILFLCDDLFFSEVVDTEAIENLVDWLNIHKAKFCRLYPLVKKKSKKILNIDIDGIIYTPRNMLYGINLGGGIFSYKFLKEIIGDGSFNGWEIEKELNKNCYKFKKNKFFKDCFCCYIPFLSLIHGISKGRFFPKARKQIISKGFAIPMNIPTMTKRQEFKVYIAITVLKLFPSGYKIINIILKKLRIRFN